MYILQFEGTPFHPGHDRFWSVIEKYKVNQFYTAPTAIRALMKFGDEPVKKYVNTVSTVKLQNCIDGSSSDSLQNSPRFTYFQPFQALFEEPQGLRFRWRADQQRSLALVLRTNRQQELLDRGYVLANGNWRTCAHTAARVHAYEAWICCKLHPRLPCCSESLCVAHSATLLVFWIPSKIEL